MYMWTDPIVDEIRKYRNEHAQKFDYDIDRIFDDLKKSEEERLNQKGVREDKAKYC